MRQFCLLSALVLCAGCATWEPHPLPGPGAGPQLIGTVRVTTDDAPRLVIDSAVVTGDSLTGIAREVQRRRVAVPLARVRQVERVEPNVGQTVTGLAITLAVAALLVWRYLIPPST
ncbi:MAG TPA: hypothetical protein VF541_21465 [Longimicrobium sp.]